MIGAGVGSLLEAAGLRMTFEAALRSFLIWIRICGEIATTLQSFFAMGI